MKSSTCMWSRRGLENFGYKYGTDMRYVCVFGHFGAHSTAADLGARFCASGVTTFKEPLFVGCTADLQPKLVFGEIRNS